MTVQPVSLVCVGHGPKLNCWFSHTKAYCNAVELFVSLILGKHGDTVVGYRTLEREVQGLIPSSSMVFERDTGILQAFHSTGLNPGSSGLNGFTD